MSEPRPDDDLTARGTTPPAEGDASSDPSAGSSQSATEIVAADMAAIDPTPAPEPAAPVTPAPDSTPPPMAAYTPPPAPPATDWATAVPPPAPPATDWAAVAPPPAPPQTDWATPAATSPTPPSGTPVQPMPETQAWAQAPAPVYQQPPAYPPQQQPQPGWPQQPPAYQPPAAYTAPPAYPPQQPYAQPPGYPPQGAWQQPGQPAGWVQPQGEYWAQPGGVYEYKSNVLAILSGVWLLLVGLLTTLGGVLILSVGQLTGALTDYGFTTSQADAFRGIFGIFAVIVLIVGILMLLSALGIFLHRSWGRVLGILFSVLGVLIGLGTLASRTSSTVLSDGRIQSVNAAPFGIGFLVIWGLCLLFLIISGGHFHKQRVG